MEIRKSFIDFFIFMSYIYHFMHKFISLLHPIARYGILNLGVEIHTFTDLITGAVRAVVIKNDVSGG